MTRRITYMAALLLLAAAGCGGLSEEEARSRCTEERQANASCSTDQSYEACVACHAKYMPPQAGPNIGK